jgi:MFS transporter, LPLT family, lysophospholipid transporter
VLVVPLNALLQHRGHVLLSAGRSIAVQNFNENLSVLVMLAAYAGLLKAGVDIRSLMAGLGAMVAGLVAALVWRERAAAVRRARA